MKKLGFLTRKTTTPDPETPDSNTGIPKYSVLGTVDTSPTKHGETIEVGIVTIVAGETVDEWETLIQPTRPVPPAPHITEDLNELLGTAPTFQNIASDLAARLDGTILVAHQLDKTIHWLRTQYSNTPKTEFHPGTGVSTHKLTRTKLEIAANKANHPLNNRTGLEDARATAAILTHQRNRVPVKNLQPATCTAADTKTGGLTVRRPHPTPRTGSLYRTMSKTSWPAVPDNTTNLYLDALDRCLDDETLTRTENSWLLTCATDLGITEKQRRKLHKRYYRNLINRIQADGTVTEQETELSEKIAEALNLTPADLTEDTPKRELPPTPKKGTRIAFAGDFTHLPGGKTQLVETSQQHGLITTHKITKNTGILVLGKGGKRTVKWKRAQQWGTPTLTDTQHLRYLTHP